MSRALLLSILAACGSAAAPPPPGSAPAPPAGGNDPAFTVSRVRAWYLIGNALTPGQHQLEIAVAAPPEVDTVDLWLDGGEGVRLVATAADHREVIDIGGLAAGEHEILLAADGAVTAFARLTFQRSHPYYVFVSTDWDDADNPQTSLVHQDNLHRGHDESLLTHFVGPYTFTDPAVAPARVGELVDWLVDQRDAQGDEIGLHIHPYCNFVNTTEVPCRTMPSTVYPAGDATGYTVMVSSYSEAEFTALLEASDALFEEAGLGKPTSFRAGGWTAELNTLRSLAAAGYRVDASANNWARMEEWDGQPPGAVLYAWNMEHWATIGDTSQPYYPSVDDILVAGPPSIPVLEVPDNGILVNYVTAEEMIDVFAANWPGGALAEPRVWSIGYHPPNFNIFYYERIDEALSHADQFLISEDRGPVVYATASQLVEVWPPP